MSNYVILMKEMYTTIWTLFQKKTTPAVAYQAIPLHFGRTTEKFDVVQIDRTSVSREGRYQ